MPPLAHLPHPRPAPSQPLPNPRPNARTNARTLAWPLRAIEQVGAELEGPYGIDDNDLPLLHMGVSLVDDLDIVLRASEQSLQWQARMQQEEAERRRHEDGRHEQPRQGGTKGGIIAAASRGTTNIRQGLASTAHVAVCWPRSHSSQAARSTKAATGAVRFDETAAPPPSRAPSCFGTAGAATDGWDTLTTTCAPAVKL